MSPQKTHSAGELRKFLDDFFYEADKKMAFFSIKELKKLIDIEVGERARPSVLTRLHRRYCTQRMAVERDNLDNKDIDWGV